MILIFITFVGAFVVQQINANNSVIRNNDLKISYHGSKKNTCDAEEYRFQAIMNSKLSDCVIECALREHCAVMNYRPDYKLCELYQNNPRTSNLPDECFRVERKDLHITQSPCNEMPCPKGTACDTTSRTCQIKECLVVPRLSNGEVRGNLRAVGNRIKYECDQGYHLVDSLHEVAECLDDGTWSTKGECVKDYIAAAVGHLCNTTNCLDPSVRCVERYSGYEYCHCIFGFEFNQTLDMCVEVCTQYSTNLSKVVRQNNLYIHGYDLNNGHDVASDEECVSYCSDNYPTYLSIEVWSSRYDKKCVCQSISEQQLTMIQGTLSPCYSCYSFNRPCEVSI